MAYLRIEAKNMAGRMRYKFFAYHVFLPTYNHRLYLGHASRIGVSLRDRVLYRVYIDDKSGESRVDTWDKVCCFMQDYAIRCAQSYRQHKKFIALKV